MRRLVLFTTLLMVAMFAVAQTPTGTIQGTVEDQQGASLGGATVVVTSANTGLIKTVSTDSSGRFELPFLNPGTYTVSVEAKGFRVERRPGVVVQVSQTLPLSIVLSVGQVSETVEVTTSTGTVDTESSSLNSVIQSKAITDLPLNGRNPFDLATLVPAVSNVGNASTPHIGGSRNANNEQQIDGMTNILPENNVGNNLAAYQPIVDSVPGIQRADQRSAGGVWQILRRHDQPGNPVRRQSISRVSVRVCKKRRSRRPTIRFRQPVPKSRPISLPDRRNFRRPNPVRSLEEELLLLLRL